MARIVELGCVACQSEHPEWLHPLEVHHLNDCGRNRGHEFTICLCGWHHEGRPPGQFNSRQAAEMFGPSLKHAREDGQTFHERYGSDDNLLAFQELLLKENPGG